MTSINPPRDGKNDWLLTPENSVMVFIDYQNVQLETMRSSSNWEIMQNVVSMAHLGKAFNIPIILSTVNVSNGQNGDTFPELKEALSGVKSYDRTSINAWEDADFKAAIEATGRKKLIMMALWTEACLTFPSIDAIREGYEIYAVSDAVGGTSKNNHDMGLRRIEQAGGIMTSTSQVATELQRDWNRRETVPDFAKILVGTGAFVKIGSPEPKTD
ncbi:MAG: hydrolase [Methanobrevibacter sp.]|jgi:nicotinamidase-related amidase|nr:hydrolase [Candidatus Methanoflexus mossambicus]